MGLRTDSTDPDHGIEETLSSGTASRRLPEQPVKRITAGVLAAMLVLSLVLPWWQTAYPLRDLTEQLFGWQLLLIGFGIGEAAALTDFSVFGNILFGAVPTVPLLVLTALLVVRAVRPRAVQARLIVVWSLFELLTLSWLLMLGWARLNATLGVHPAMLGMLPAVMVCAFGAIAFANWWRGGERDLYPRRRLQIGGGESEPLLDAEGRPVTAERLFEGGDEVPDAAGEADTGEEPQAGDAVAEDAGAGTDTAESADGTGADEARA